jgi:hypothetical protein
VAVSIYSDRRVVAAAVIVVAAALGMYVRTMMPSTGFWDTAEAQTVPHTLSIFHPTGFPAYAVVGWAWSQLPIGEVAYRMNLLSAVSIALAAGFVTLIVGHLVDGRGWVVAGAAGIGGAAFAFAAEPWENATRADVHALNVLMVAVVIWLLVVWRAAERSGSPRSGRWLVGAAAAFGVGLGFHPLLGMAAFGIAVWLIATDPYIWRRWRLLLACAAVLAVGTLAAYAYIPIRAAIDPEPPLFYARPETWERVRYLIFAEQFEPLFDEFNTPFSDLPAKIDDVRRVLEPQLFGPGWLLAAVGASFLAARRPAAFAFLGLVFVADVFYSMNFRDGDIDRYYLPAILVACVVLGVALAELATAAAEAIGRASRTHRLGVGRVVGATVLALALGLPVGSVVVHYRSHDQSRNYEADRWVTSVHEALPRDSVLISWWSYSTPLWYHRWVLGARPDITIIDERNILDDGYRTMTRAINAFLGERPVYVVPPHWNRQELLRRWETTTIQTYPGYTEVLRIEGRRAR